MYLGVDVLITLLQNIMAYEVIILYHLHMPCILWEHLPNIPNECPKREVQDYLVHLFFVFDSTVIG